MPQWVNGKDRPPTRHGQYFVKINGTKELLRLHEIEKKIEWDYDIFWLDESDIEQAKINSIRSAGSIDEMVKAKYEAGTVPVNIGSAFKAKQGDIVEDIIKSKPFTSNERIAYLENLFGVKRAKNIIKKIKQL